LTLVIAVLFSYLIFNKLLTMKDGVEAESASSNPDKAALKFKLDRNDHSASHEDSSDLNTESKKPLETIQNSISSPLEEIVSHEKLVADIESHKEQMEKEGRRFRTPSGKEYYVVHDPKIEREQPDSLYKYGVETTIEELVKLSKKGDVAATFTLADIAYLAGRWDEGEYLALEVARQSGLTESLILSAYHRDRIIGEGFHNRYAASWYLAAYILGDISAASSVSSLFATMSEADQRWAIERSQLIISQLEPGG